MSFENDVFISYAHIDDVPLIEGQKGWIANFHRALEVRLAQLLGRNPRIWRDPKLQGNDIFADRLVERLPGVAILVSVISPRSFCGRKSCAASARAWPAVHATPIPHSMSERSTLAPRPQRPAARMVASRTAVSAPRAR